MSGSGKSVALHAMEDAGYYCVDNLPPELLAAFVDLEHKHHGNRVAIAMDVRSATSLPPGSQRTRPSQVTRHRRPASLFLDATTGTLIRRFSETDGVIRYPTTNYCKDAKPWFKSLNSNGTSCRPSRTVSRDRHQPHQVVTTSKLCERTAVGNRGNDAGVPVFCVQAGIPVDADYVFDVRMLPNPHYEEFSERFDGLGCACGRVFGTTARGTHHGTAH